MSTIASAGGPASTARSNHRLRRDLGLRDLVPMQILLVVGFNWPGIAAHQGPTHVVFWLLAVLLLLLPVASVVAYCSRIWPQEGGVYQWTKHALGPFCGFLSAWNFGLWGLVITSSSGILLASGLSYALGPSAAWMEESTSFICALNVGVFAFMLLINVPGLGVGRWIAHFGTTVSVVITTLLIAVLVVHSAPAATAHISPQAPFSFAVPATTLMTVNLFSKLAFNGLTGLEQVAIFAGETRQPERTILRSAWIATPTVALMYILITGSMLAFTPAAQIDLAAPVPQALAAAFAASHGTAVSEVALMCGRGAILALALAQIAQNTVIIAETSRLPLVAAWDDLLPSWFMKLHPRFRTPTSSLFVIVGVALGLGMFASVRAGTQEAFQVIATSANLFYGLNYLLMFAVPLAAGSRFGQSPSPLLRLGCLCGSLVTCLSMAFSLLPIVDVHDAFTFALKVGSTFVILNLIGILLYWRGSRRVADGGRKSC